MGDWRQIDGFPAYEVSSTGSVRNCFSGHVLRPQIGHRGHQRVTLSNNNKQKRLLVHRLVLTHFGEPCPPGKECAHWDGDAGNNNAGNLRWATRKENSQDTIRHGRTTYGERNHFSKLNHEQVREIRERIAAGFSTRVLAEQFNISLTTVNKIALGKNWRHLGPPLREAHPRSTPDKERIAAAVAAVKDGASAIGAAKTYGVDRKTIARLLAPEKLIHAAVIQHWQLFGEPDTLVATQANMGAMGQPGLTPGLPDLLVMGPRVPGRIGFIELKRDEKSPTTPDQDDFHNLCARLGVACEVTHGRDEPIALLQLWGVVRGVSESVVNRARAANSAGRSTGVATGERQRV